MAAVASAMRGDQVLYIDTSASFSGRRAATVFNELHLRLQVLLAFRTCFYNNLLHTATQIALTSQHADVSQSVS